MLKIYKTLLFGLFILVLFIPMIQAKKNYFEVGPLNGAVHLQEKPKFSYSSWYSGEFQKNYENYVNDNMGFRSWLVRFHNEIEFQLFGKVNANRVILGKEDFLFEENYIRAYNGQDFNGGKKIDGKTKKLREIQDKLKSMNKTLIVCLAPGKASFYPEYIPKHLLKPKTDSTNLFVYRKLLEKYGVNYIDLNTWFIQQKGKGECDLYPKTGIHWSQYGALLAADSLARFIGEKHNILIEPIKIYDLHHTSKNHYLDRDIEEGMNLIFPIEIPNMCYPKYEIKSKTGLPKAKLLAIGDSFYSSLLNLGFGTELFDLGSFWYYNNLIYPESNKKTKYVKEVNFRDQINASDVLLIMSTDANLSKLGWGFIEQLHDELFKK